MSLTNDLIVTLTIRISNAGRAEGDQAVEDMITTLQKFETEGMEVTINDLRPSFNTPVSGDQTVSKPEDDPITYMDVDAIFDD
jgi:hypothetical protein